MRKLIFDGDGSQYTPYGKPCSLCDAHQRPDDSPHSVFIRVRERVPQPGGFSTIERAQICPECIARMFLQMERLKLWDRVSLLIRAAIRRQLMAHCGLSDQNQKLMEGKK